MGNINELAFFSEKELLCTLLIREHFQDKNLSKEFFSKDMIVKAVRSKYLQLNETCPLTDEELITWLKKNYRYPLLTDLIEEELAKLVRPQKRNNEIIDLTDNFLYQNLELVLHLLTNEVTKALYNEVNYENTKMPLPPLDDKNFNLLIHKFLQIVDPTLKWTSIYEEAIKKNIIFVNKDDLDLKEKLVTIFQLDTLGITKTCPFWNFTLYEDNEVYSVVERTDTIEDLPRIVHEFSHFLELKFNQDKKFSIFLSEYSPIFYELVSYDFLEMLGYDKIYIEKLRHKRNSNTYLAGILTLNIFNFMKKVLNNKTISKEEEINEAKRIVNLNEKLDKKTKDELRKTKPYYFDSILYSEHICDDAIIKLLENPNEISKKYPYIIGSFLANKTLEDIKENKNTFEDIKFIVEHTSLIEPTDIFKFLDIDLKFYQENGKNKIKKY